MKDFSEFRRALEIDAGQATKRMALTSIDQVGRNNMDTIGLSQEGLTALLSFMSLYTAQYVDWVLEQYHVWMDD